MVCGHHFDMAYDKALCLNTVDCQKALSISALTRGLLTLVVEIDMCGRLSCSNVGP
jgi:hypothetical protein